MPDTNEGEKSMGNRNFDFNQDPAGVLNEGMTYSEYMKEGKASVYEESVVPAGHTRFWISFDIDNQNDKDADGNTRRDKLYDWLNHRKQIESWGNSVATFLTEECFRDSSNSDAIDYLVKEFKTANVFNNNIEWAKTPDISLYVTYRSRNLSHNTYSGHFVLIQNAKIKQPRGFRC